MNAALAIVLALAAVCAGTAVQYVPTSYSNVQYVQQPQYKYVQQQVVPSTQYVYKSPVQYTVPTTQYVYKNPVQYTVPTTQYAVPSYYAAGSSPVVSTYGHGVYSPSYVYGYGK